MNPSSNALARPIDLYSEGVAKHRRNSKAKKTREAYESDWDLFRRWCVTVKESPLPAHSQTISSYITYLAAPHEVTRTYQTLEGSRPVTRIVSCKYSTIQRALITIGMVHKAWYRERLTPEQQQRVSAGLLLLPNPAADPDVREVLAGIRRTIGVERTKKAALLTADLRKIFMNIEDPDAPIVIRDRAILLLGFAGGFRRSELTALDIKDLMFKPSGLLVKLRRSKTNQEGKKEEKAIPRGTAMCPVRAVERWLDMLGGSEAKGPLFRPFRGRAMQTCRLQPRVIAKIVKHYAELVDKDPAKLGGHSLRRGHITQRKRNGDSDTDIMQMTGHTNAQMLAEYTEAAKDPFDVLCRLGL